MKDDFEKALEGNQNAMLRMMVLSLATQMAALAMFIPKTHDALRRSSMDFAKSAMDFLNDTKETT